MSTEQLEANMRVALAKSGKPQAEIDKVVAFILAQPSLQTNETRQIFFNQWSNKL